MKKIIIIGFLLLGLMASGQRKHLIKDGKIVQSGLPSVFVTQSGETIWGNYQLLEDRHYSDGWRDEIVPKYNPKTQRLGQHYYNASMDIVTWVVVNKTPEEIAVEKEQEAERKESEIDVVAVKRLLQKTVEKSLDYNALTEEQIADLTTIYPQYRIGKSYVIGEVFATNNNLFKVIQAHTSQADWLPESTPALYAKFTPPGQVAAWVQPTGAQDAYQMGDKVLFEGSTYESLINANVWSPTAYPAGWKKL